MFEAQVVPGKQHGGSTRFVGAVVKDAVGQIRLVVVQISFTGSQQLLEDT